MRQKATTARGNRKLKLIDRYLGIPLVFGLGLLRRRHAWKPASQIRRVAFLRTCAIGDTVLLTAAIQDLREAIPDVEITLFTGQDNYGVAGMVPGVDAVIKLPVTNVPEAIGLIRSCGHFDVWIDSATWARIDALFSFFSRASFRVGFRAPGQSRHHVYDAVVSHRSDLHQVENFRRLLEPIGVRGDCRPALNRPAQDADPRLIAIHMFPGGYRAQEKEWPEARWIEVIERLLQAGYSVALTGAPKDRQRALDLWVRAGKPQGVRVAAGELSLSETAALLCSAALVISVDTGTMHMAAALGCPLVSLHGPSPARRWGPVAERAIAIESTCECAPCLDLGFEYPCAASQGKCMGAIPVTEVLAAAARFIPVGVAAVGSTQRG